MLPTTFTFKVKNQNLSMEGGKMVEKKKIKIKHKALAAQELENPVAFKITPRVEVMFDEKGVAEVPFDLGESLLATQPEIYELVKEATVAPASAPAPKAKVAKTEQGQKDQQEKADFAKQITE